MGFRHSLIASLHLILLHYVSISSAFLSLPLRQNVCLPLSSPSSSSSSYLSATDQRNSGGGNRRGQKTKKKKVTLQDLVKEVSSDPNKFRQATGQSKKSKVSKRSRKRVNKPKQKYVYASQRREMEMKGKKVVNQDQSSSSSSSGQQIKSSSSSPSPSVLALARSMGLNPSRQHCDVLVDDITPRILGSIHVGDDEDDSSSSSFAYVIEKPTGWSILGSGGGGGKSDKKKQQKQQPQAENNAETLQQSDNVEEETATIKKKKNAKRVKYLDEDGSTGFMEYDLDAVRAIMTPEELAEMEADEAAGILDAFGIFPSSSGDDGSGSSSNIKQRHSNTGTAQFATGPSSTRPSLVSWLKEFKASQGILIRGGKNWKAIAGATDVDDSGLVLLCPKDKVDSIHVDEASYVAVIGNGKYMAPKPKANQQSGGGRNQMQNREGVALQVKSKLRKGRGDDTLFTATINIPDGLSDCGDVVQLCQDQFLDGVRGDPNANPLDRRAARRLIHCSSISASSLIQDDSISVACDSIPDDITIWSDRRHNFGFEKGAFLGRKSLQMNNSTTSAYREINGAADGFPGWIVDRYGKFLFVQHDDKNHPNKGPLPSIHDGYTAGVYYYATNRDRSVMSKVKPVLLEGRAVRESDAYYTPIKYSSNDIEYEEDEEMYNSDDYDLDEFDDNMIEDEFDITDDELEKYMLEFDSDEEEDDEVAAFPVVENGVTYHVSLGDALSTGIFLDQRPQRAWLTRNCSPETRVLNCFAHCGAFSVAAATAGASTVSLDLDKKWLDRVWPQIIANGIEEDSLAERHDCIYGDCKF